MDLSTALQALAVRMGTEAKSLRTLINGNVADLTSLTTTQKANLVAAINDLQAQVTSLATQEGGATINDGATSTSQVWSSSKTTQEIATASTADRNRANHTGTQPISSVDGLQAALDEAGTAEHTHVIGDVTGLQSALNAKANAADLTAHTENTNNPHSVTKAQVGLANVPNVDATSRATHTGTQLVSTISDFNTAAQAIADARIDALVGAAPAALDTLAELAAALGDDPNFAGTITEALSNRVRVDAAQAFSTGERAQGRSNIAAAAAADLAALVAAVGNTDHDFVATFEAALA